jgi:hypothetical protein
VRRSQTIADLQGDIDQLACAVGVTHRLAVDQLHYDVVLAGVVDLRDVRVIEDRNGPRLVLEPIGKPACENLIEGESKSKRNRWTEAVARQPSGPRPPPGMREMRSHLARHESHSAAPAVQPSRSRWASALAFQFFPRRSKLVRSGGRFAQVARYARIWRAVCLVPQRQPLRAEFSSSPLAASVPFLEAPCDFSVDASDGFGSNHPR